MATRKMTLIAAIAAVILVAVGVGYAYTASTQNGGNNVNSEYITLVQGGEGAYKFSDNVHLEWNTLDRKVDADFVTEFTMVGMVPGAEEDHMDGFNIKQLGTPFTVLTEGKGMDSHPDLECSILKSGSWNVYGNFETTFFLKVENGPTTTWFRDIYVPWNPAFEKYNDSTSAWDGGTAFDIAYDSANGKYYDTTVTVYYAIAGDKLSITHDSGEHPQGQLPTYPIQLLQYPLQGAFLTFTVSN